jgi:hypothetical protein
MAKKSDLFSKIRHRLTATGKTAKFATPKFDFDLSKLVKAPASLARRLGIRGAYVAEGKLPSVRSTIVSPAAMRKAVLERQEGRPLSHDETGRIRARRRYVRDYLKRKTRMDPRLDQPDQFPSSWNPAKTFEENWTTDQKRFLRLAWERTGIRFELDGRTGEWTKVEVAGAPRKLMSDADWLFYTRHFYANEELYGPIAADLFELPPGEVSPRVHSRGRARRRLGRGGTPRTEREAMRRLNRTARARPRPKPTPASGRTG